MAEWPFGITFQNHLPEQPVGGGEGLWGPEAACSAGAEAAGAVKA